jgi:hypothetical protein
VLKTTNPILRAYKYVQVEPPYQLALQVTRHKEVDVQNAAIDDARYQTLYTRDGLSVTTAHFTVRNSREQFLKVRLPRGSKVWSAFVAGRAEKPAIEEAKDADPTVLIKIINSSEGFPVELVYETATERIGALGRVRGSLPNPDMVVTRSSWDVYLPFGLQYGDPESNMEQGAQGEAGSADWMKSALAARAQNAAVPPLRFDVPTSGVRYTFNKIYANHSEQAASFSISYNSRGGAWLARLMALCGTTLFWLGMVLLPTPSRRRVALGLTAGGGVLVLLAVGSFGVSLAWPVLFSLVLGAASGLRWLIANRPRSVAA